jgi:hypothetical protein
MPLPAAARFAVVATCIVLVVICWVGEAQDLQRLQERNSPEYFPHPWCVSFSHSAHPSSRCISR